MKIAVPLLLSILVLSSVTVSAQDYSHEISFYAGAGSMPSILEHFQDIGLFLLFPPLTKVIRTETETVTPALVLRYRNHLGTLVSLCGEFSYQQFEKRYILLDKEASASDIKYYTFMGRVDFTYVRSRLLQMYSGLGLGFSHATESGKDTGSASETYFALQINAVGLRVGEKVAGFMELGFGFNGIICGGITVRF